MSKSLLLQCRLRGKIDSNGVVAAYLEERLNMGVNFILSAEVSTESYCHSFSSAPPIHLLNNQEIIALFVVKIYELAILLCSLTTQRRTTSLVLDWLWENNSVKAIALLWVHMRYTSCFCLDEQYTSLQASVLRDRFLPLCLLGAIDTFQGSLFCVSVLVYFQLLWDNMAMGPMILCYRGWNKLEWVQIMLYRLLAFGDLPFTNPFVYCHSNKLRSIQRLKILTPIFSQYSQIFLFINAKSKIRCFMPS